LISLHLPADEGAVNEAWWIAYMMCFFASLDLSATSFVF